MIPRFKSTTLARMFRALLPLLVVIAVMVLSVVDVRAVDPAPETLPGFSDTLVLSKPQVPASLKTIWGAPTDLKWTPDGRLLLIAQKMGRLFVYSGTANITLAMDINSRICFNGERGLVGLAIDPEFASNGFIYMYYTRKTDPTCPQGVKGATSGFPYNRVSRFVFNSTTNTVDLNSETVLVDNIVAYAGNHNSGYLHIAADGYLYVSVGETGKPALSRRLDSLRGKILRISRTSGDGAPDNPNGSNPAAVRCGDPQLDRNEQGAPCREVFASGLRNPFRLAFKPNSNEFFINDVGKQTWEEISGGVKGANYGWDDREGPCPFETVCLPGSTSPLPGSEPASTTAPVFWYRHTSNGGSDVDPQFRDCNSITGGAFVPPGVWPAEYEGDYIFGDYVCGRMWRLQPNAAGRYQATTFVEDLFLNSLVSMTFGPGPNGQSLYYSTLNGGGQVHRIDYTGGANRVPSARLTADKTYSLAAPLEVNFDASASSDPDGQALTYMWDFGIVGATRETTTPTTRFTYTQKGIYTARLKVRDSEGAVSSEVGLTIAVGDEPPDAEVVAPASSMRFKVGQKIALRATASDNNGGPVALSWEVFQHHNEHEHPWDTGQGNTIEITAPAPEDLYATGTSYLRIELTATDEQGLSRVVERIIPPHTVDVTLASQPQGAAVDVNRVPLTAPHTLLSWEGYDLIVQAQQQNIGGRWMTPTRWTDGASPNRTIVTPATPATYTLQLQPTQPGAPGSANRITLPLVSR